MTAIDASSKVTQAIEERVEAITEDSSDVVLGEQAADLVNELRLTDPDALIDWFHSHAVTLIRQQLQARLAIQRRGTRSGVFDNTTTAKPFTRRYAVEGNVWKRIGEMTRPDWRCLIEERTPNALASLFDMALAKRMVERLPDDETRTCEVLSEAEFIKLEDQAQQAAERTVGKFS